MSFDIVLLGPSEDFLASLNQTDRMACYSALDTLSNDPYADGDSKVLLDWFPFQPGAIGAAIGEFWIVYQILNAATLEIAVIYWSPDSPRR